MIEVDRTSPAAATRTRRIIGRSEALREILAQVALVAPTDATVLLTGEPGTGKELFAREIHEQSQRAHKPLVKVSCSAVPRGMFESELFGHVRGAFTGALRDRHGRFQLAQNGTLFLDEVGDLPLALQPKLLRVLQQGQYERVGDDATRRIDVRVIAVTRRDLALDVKAGVFRQDLYDCLSVFRIDIPPLRARKEDLAPLAAYFVTLATRALGTSEPSVDEQQWTALANYEWPGNVRELQNFIERAVILARGGELRLDHPVIREEEMRRRERANLVAALARTGGKIYGPDGAAALLGVKPTTLQSRLRALGIVPQARVRP